MAEIGSTLREARMRARIDITEVEARTKIRAKYLRALENEEWDLLPGPIYVKSFLRTYGDYLGLDSRLLIDDFKRRFERPSDGELRPIATLHRERERAARGPAASAVGDHRGCPRRRGGGARHHRQPEQLDSHRLDHRGQARRPPPPDPPSRRPGARPAEPPSTVRLQLTPTGSVYICLVDGSGPQADQPADLRRRPADCRCRARRSSC